MMFLIIISIVRNQCQGTLSIEAVDSIKLKNKAMSSFFKKFIKIVPDEDKVKVWTQLPDLFMTMQFFEKSNRCSIFS